MKCLEVDEHWMKCLKERVKCKKSMCLELFLRLWGAVSPKHNRDMKESVKWTMTLFFCSLVLSQKTHSAEHISSLYTSVIMYACHGCVFEALRTNTDNHVQVVKSSFFREMRLAILHGTWCEKSNPI